MHGSSSVPQELLAIIREFGGDMKETYGVPVEEIQEGIKHGVRKINIDTDIRLAMTAAIRKYLFQNPVEVRPARLPQAGARSGHRNLQGALPVLRLRRQAGKIKPVPRQDGRALQAGRAGADRQLRRSTAAPVSYPVGWVSARSAP
jgi:fructose-bisphosphate aldolase class II